MDGVHSFLAKFRGEPVLTDFGSHSVTDGLGILPSYYLRREAKFNPLGGEQTFGLTEGSFRKGKVCH